MCSGNDIIETQNVTLSFMQNRFPVAGKVYLSCVIYVLLQIEFDALFPHLIPFLLQTLITWPEVDARNLFCFGVEIVSLKEKIRM